MTFLLTILFPVQNWRTTFDDALIKQLSERDISVPQPSATQGLCPRCREMNLDTPVARLHHPSPGCQLCQILSKALAACESPSMRLLDAEVHVRIRRPYPSGAGDELFTESTVPYGFANVLDSGSRSHFTLIKGWLRLCDNGACSAGGRCTEGIGHEIPTRLVDIGDGENGKGKICLVPTDRSFRGQHYIALSHCWGSLADSETDRWVTNADNYKNRTTQGFEEELLPATFRDAIRVTRQLKKRYMWIDSICIIQGDLRDWRAEARKMTSVFRNAYCTIAASSAQDSKQGFLGRQREPTESVRLPSSSHGDVIISNFVDDFAGDVEGSVLSSRAWVLQERVLSRRTIHFTSRQTYWECGGGVRCETLTHKTRRVTAGSVSWKEKKRKKSQYLIGSDETLLSTPDFPRSLPDGIPATQGHFDVRIQQITLFKALFERYSSLGISHDTDRNVAIVSVATELARHWHTELSHGVFQLFLHRGLAWRRATEAGMGRICYPKARAERIKAVVLSLVKRGAYTAERPPPSWSWMARSGGIEYLPLANVIWDMEIRLEKDVLRAWVAPLRGCGCIQAADPAQSLVVYAEDSDMPIGRFWFDDPTRGSAVRDGRLFLGDVEVYCALLGDASKTSHTLKEFCVLAVAKAQRRWPKKFERIGIGFVAKMSVDFDDRSPSIIV